MNRWIAAVCVALVGAAAWAFDLPEAEHFARRPAIASVVVSPDGAHLAAVLSPDGDERVIAIWQADALTEAPFIVGSDPRSEVQSVRFLTSDRMLVVTQQLVDHNPFTGRTERSYGYRQQILDLEGNPIRTSLRFDGLTQAQQAYVGTGSLISALPADPEHVLVAAPRTGDIYRLNLYSGRAERAERGSTRFSAPRADLSGDIRARQTFDFEGGSAYIGVWLKNPDSGSFDEHFRWFARDREPVSIAAFTPEPDLALVQSTSGRDHAAIYEYNLRGRDMVEIAFAHPYFEATGVVQSTAQADYGDILGFRYHADRSRVYWIDPVLEETERQLRSALGVEMADMDWTDIQSGTAGVISVPDGADIEITSWSDDRSRMVITRSGGDTPPEYHVLIDGRLQLLGRAYPELQGAALGDVRLLQYQARDGLMIPAFLTTPDPGVHGAGPWPAIVTPHGGPWARDNLDWDVTGWTQYFAARGYAVLQPQFRGSQGWGQRLWRAGDREWGRAMQDDKNDGALWMAEQGIADPDRIAMHGYSYGGYAAMMAAVRGNGIYRCAAAGAGPATIDMFKKATFNSRFLREFQHPTAEGVDPLRHVGDASIPVLLYTGDRDTNVLPAESETFAAALRRAGKDVEIRILPDMEHTLNTWTPENFAAILTSVEAFLSGACGMGGE
jgi:dipeptidyl aminopeptidase/acylaminoacyl peptidase